MSSREIWEFLICLGLVLIEILICQYVADRDDKKKRLEYERSKTPEQIAREKEIHEYVMRDHLELCRKLEEKRKADQNGTSSTREK